MIDYLLSRPVEAALARSRSRQIPLRPGIPESLARIILACLAKQRLERPSGAAELDRMLMRVRP